MKDLQDFKYMSNQSLEFNAISHSQFTEIPFYSVIDNRDLPEIPLEEGVTRIDEFMLNWVWNNDWDSFLEVDTFEDKYIFDESVLDSMFSDFGVFTYTNQSLIPHWNTFSHLLLVEETHSKPILFTDYNYINTIDTITTIQKKCTWTSNQPRKNTGYLKYRSLYRYI